MEKEHNIPLLGPQECSPPDCSTICARVYKSLEAWSGFSIFDSLMKEYPGLDLYLAGGAVRDTILGIRSKKYDFDFFLGGKQVQSAISYLGLNGSMTLGPFGSSKWLPKWATLPSDIVPIDKFYNGLWICNDIIDVLNQFDFTGNAVAIDIRTGQFFDPQNGFRDLQNRIMRAIRFDYPDEPINQTLRITRPAVVWFRILHYASERNLTIEKITYNWLQLHNSYKTFRREFQSTFFTLTEKAFSILLQKHHD